MAEPLEIHLNRDAPHSIEVAEGTYEADGTFRIYLRNYGEALHVHLHLDDELSRVASLGTSNHFVRADSVRRVAVDVVDGPRPISGRLKVVTGYGSETAYIDLSIVDAVETDSRVEVDERLGRPAPKPGEEPTTLGVEHLPVAALALVAVLLALFGAFTVGGVAASVGVLAVLLGVGAAIALVLR